MMLSYKRILLSAFECNPYMGSDAEVGWQWAKQLSKRGYDVTVVTRRTHQKEIEKYIAETNDCKNVCFEYVDIEWLYPITELINPRNHVYYYFWQLKAMFQVKILNRKNPFNLIHHVTWVSFRQPSFMGLLGVPMYFGPVAGGDEIPKGYANTFTFKRRLVESFRTLVNMMVRFDPLMLLTYASAQKVFFTSESHLNRVPNFVRRKAQIELAIGCDFQESDINTTDTSKLNELDKPELRTGNRLLFVGRFLSLKGMDIGLQAFAQVRKSRPDVSLTMVGDGLERDRWMQKAKQLGVDAAIEWRGWLSKDEVQNLYSKYDIFFFPSLRDSGGFVVLEALQRGMPVVCLKLGGPGLLVDESCGIAVIPRTNIQDTVQELAISIMNILSNSRPIALSERCNQRAQHFTWDGLIERIYEFNK